MQNATRRAGHGLAKALGVKLQEKEPVRDELSRGESIFSIQTTDTFVEQQPRSIDWVVDQFPSRKDTTSYLWSLFPFLTWISKYNWSWLAGDAVAGITIGAVVVPQGMAYAGLAELDVQFGLYSSFMGVLVYWFFATSKDITIGPVAVMSLLVGNVVTEVRKTHPEFAKEAIASCLSVLAGAVILGLGLVRIGWIVDLIPLTSLSAFMTGSAINIAVGQIPPLLGIQTVETRGAAYRVFINTLKHLGDTKLDAAMGLSALTMLYALRHGSTALAHRFPKKQKAFFFGSTLRTVFVILLYTLISFLVNMKHADDPSFQILMTVPRGFQNAGVPTVNTTLVKLIAPYLPATIIVLLIEHIAISKSFGRVNNYTINPSQEMVGIGVANMMGPFMGGYPVTGSFTRTAIASKAGVRTPLAGLITAMVVLLAIYALPPMFYYIPKSVLAAVIIHAVIDLITTPNTVYQFWRVSPLEVFVFFVGVFIAVFVTIEDGIYATVGLSAAILIFRILKARGRFLGKVKVHSVLGDHVIGDDHRDVLGEYGTFSPPVAQPARNVFLPIGHPDGSNPEVEVDNPYPGIFIYRFSEGFNYPNASHTLEHLTSYVFANTRRTNKNHFAKRGDRPWNDPGPSRLLKRKNRSRYNNGSSEGEDGFPTLKAVILDFSSVNNVDITSVQQLIDVRNQLDRYTSPDFVDWHIACINNRWTKRALVSAGFGYPAERADGLQHRWRSIFSVAEIGGEDSPAELQEVKSNAAILSRTTSMHVGATLDIESGLAADSSEAPTPANGKASAAGEGEEAGATISGIPCTESRGVKAVDMALKRKQNAVKGRPVAVHGLNRPLFHVDLTSALQSAIANVEARMEVATSESEGAVTGR
ncbi:hypothetical protein MKZ38_005383 [Zalerion maritima]|uniref:STAS domain-containing protein n=1 Tax=Zalerion maritima TaxID=339359 RepID=A0AAD5RK93_9PEZI|nr:hypothetical protein MKZ38_005383 [Zalerion maritima]